VNFVVNRLHNILSNEPRHRLITLSQESPELGSQAAIEMLRRFDEVLLPTQSVDRARAAAVDALPAYEQKLPAWRAERERLRRVYEEQLRSAIAADVERRAMSEASYRRLSAPQIIDLARSEAVDLSVDETGQLVASGTPSALLRAHLRLTRDAVISTLRYAKEVI
jgi:F0F1-type ATP synthase membrane subunit b/b'